jgi:HSP20 family protein
MTLMVRRDPFSELRAVQNDFSRALNSVFPRMFSGEEVLGGNWAPKVDIYEDENSIVLEADLPGIKPEEFKLSIENFKLTLSGERKFEEEDRGENYHRVERSYGTFTRTFTLPSTVNVDEVHADFNNGVLRVTLPKREEVKAREIKVEVKSGAVGNKAKTVEAN